MAITDRNLSIGTQLYAKYKGQTYTAEVIEIEGKARYRVHGLEETFNSPSAAGTAVTSKACNGWAFWTVGEPPVAAEPAAKETKARAPRTRKGKTAKAGNGDAAAEPPEIPDGTVGKHANGKFACEVCGAEFEDEGGVTSHYIEAHAS